MKYCKNCNKTITEFEVRCSICRTKNTEKRKYKRRHIHRLKHIKKC